MLDRTKVGVVASPHVISVIKSTCVFSAVTSQNVIDELRKTKSEEIVSSIEYLSNYIWAIIKLIIFGLLLLLLLPILA